MIPTKEEFLDALALMETLGGSFAAALAKAALLADSHNWVRLYIAFQPMFEHYRKLVGTTLDMRGKS